MVETEIITRVITFFFPYGSKIEETNKWYPGDPRDYSEGHPDGHEMWGHGQTNTKTSSEEEKDDEFKGNGNDGWNWFTKMPIASTVGWELPTATPPTVVTGTTQKTSETSDDYIGLVLALYIILLIVAFGSNILVANTIKKFKWGMKMALLFHMCLVGALVCITNSLHFLATVHHLVKRSRNSDFILQLYAVIAWIDHAFNYSLLIFIMFFAIFCFKFYWNNKTRRVDWGRSYIIYAVISSWILSFLFAFFSAFFECDSHIGDDRCIRVICATSNIFSSIFTELLTRVRIVVPIIIILLIIFSVRVGSSKQKRESVGNIEGADIHGDSELMLVCSLLFAIYEFAMLIPQLFQFFCISPLVTVCAYHFCVLIATLATPIAIITISRKTRSRFLAIYTCSTSRTAPQGSFAHVAKKYKDNNQSENENDHKSRRQSTISLVSQEHHNESNDEWRLNKDVLNVIEEEGEPPKYEEATKRQISHSASSVKKVPIQELSVGGRRATFSHSQSISTEHGLNGRRFSNYTLPPIDDNNRYMVEFTQHGTRDIQMKISKMQKGMSIQVKPANE
ncbi:unnamed protein product [Caenorhabditis angaria]|uniref:Uncharacterized protein n=1 Tax=Caenorhabditis angaria TaxID=860376 RepID=A0A9P1MZU1_9PELO|nr:unnamed protein product [Caenorhabditis angaria]